MYTITDKNMEKELANLKSEWKALKEADDNYPNKEVLDKWIEGLEKKISELLAEDSNGITATSIHADQFYTQIKHVMNHKEELSPQELFFHDNEAGLKKLFRHGDKLKDCEYWDTLRHFYQMMEDFTHSLSMFKKAFLSKKECKDNLMSKKERAFLAELPDKVTIYRGMSIDESKSENYGISWTLSEEQAKFFAYTRPENRYMPHQKTVVKKVIPKEEIIGYFSDREEEEVIWISG